MRRGLLSWSKIEIPHAVYDMRIAQTQAAMATDGIDALLLYTNLTRPAAVSWLTGFVPYWSECLAFVPHNGRPTLAAALSKRVHEWIAQTAWIEAIVAAPRLGTEIGKLCTSLGEGKRIGILELETAPTRIVDDLSAAGIALVDATALFDRLRARADGTEIALAGAAARIASDALDAIPSDASDVLETVATVEHEARWAGAEEVYIAVATEVRDDAAFFRAQNVGARFGETFAVRATVAYRGTWVRMARTLARGPHAQTGLRLASERFAEAVVRLPDTSGLQTFANWLIEGTTRSQPLQALADSRTVGLPAQPLDGKIVTVSATVVVDGSPFRFAAPVVVGDGERPGALLVPPIL